MQPFYILERKALKAYDNRAAYAYFYGAKNVVLSDQVMNDLIRTYWNEHFKRYDQRQLENIKNFSRNKIGLDCSGFITLISGLYGSSAMLYNSCPVKTSIEQGKAGSLLFKSSGSGNHCGLDLGYGYCLHIPSEMHTIEITKIQAVGFTKSGELPGFDYSQAQNF